MATAAAVLPLLGGRSSNPQETDEFLTNHKYRLVFESGVHAFHPDQYEATAARFRRGDLTAHLWPSEVAQRIRQYQPQIIALDSFSPNWWSNESLWRWLPGSPREMTGRESMFLLAADPVFVKSFDDVDKPGTWGHEARKTELNELYRLVQLSLLEGFGSLGVGAAAVGAGLYQHHRQAIEKLVDPDNADSISRRDFLKKSSLLVGGGLLAVTAGRAAPLIQSFMTESQYTDMLNYITEITRPIVARSDWWLDGRTAFTIAKTRDAMRKLKLPEGSTASLVFGYPHAYEASPLMRDESYRAEVMRKFAVKMIDCLIKANERFPIRDWSEEEKPKLNQMLRDDVLAFLCGGAVETVSEPKLVPGKTPQQAAVDAFTDRRYFISEEVRRAFKPLGDFDEKYLSKPDI